MATADPIQLQTFNAVVEAAANWTTGPILIQLNGPGVTVSGETARDHQSGRLLSPCFFPLRCQPGGIVDFTWTTPTLGFQAYDGSTMRVDGRELNVLALDGVFDISGPSTQIPPIVDGLAEVSAPVNVTASLVAYLSAAGWEESTRVDLRLRGQGMAHVLLRRPSDSIEWLDDTTIRFGASDPAPVPEPATLTLVGIGLVATGWRARRRRTG